MTSIRGNKLPDKHHCKRPIRGRKRTNHLYYHLFHWIRRVASGKLQLPPLNQENKFEKIQKYGIKFIHYQVEEMRRWKSWNTNDPCRRESHKRMRILPYAWTSRPVVEEQRFPVSWMLMQTEELVWKTV